MILRTGLLVGILAFAALAATAAPQETVGVQSADSLSRPCRRIVHLASGTAWTGLARQQNGIWQLKQDGAWIPLREGQVKRAPKEADVLAGFKRLRKENNSTVDGQLAVAQWCAGEGLYKQALTELDLLLERSPHHREALRFIAESTFIPAPSLEVSPQERPAAMERVMKFGASMGPAARERAIWEMGKLEDREPVHRRLKTGLGKPNAQERSFCAQALGRLFPREDPKRLLQHALLDTNGGVRRSAAEALGAAGQPELIAPVVRALNSSIPRVRLQASTALGHMGYPEAVKPLIQYMAAAAAAGSQAPRPTSYIFMGRQTAYVQDFDVEVATTQAVADPQINALIQGSVLQASALGTIEYSFATTSRYARQSLSRLTGEVSHMSRRSWANWWEKNATQWEKRTTITARGSAD